MTTSTETVQVWREDRSARLRDLIRQLYTVVAALEEEFEGRRFTPDGHLVGVPAKWLRPMHSISLCSQHQMQFMTRRHRMARLFR